MITDERRNQLLELAKRLIEIGEAIRRDAIQAQRNNTLLAQRLRTAKREIDTAMPKAPARD